MVMDIVSFADWKRMEFKVGKVLAAEKVAGADKLLKLTVNTGEERTLVAGVAAVYSPEELVGTCAFQGMCDLCRAHAWIHRNKQVHVVFVDTNFLDFYPV